MISPLLDDSLTPLLGLLSLAIGVALYVWTALALAAMFRKMGEEPWKGWVPLLNQATVLRWGGLNPWLVLLVFLPLVGPLALWVLQTVAAHRLNPGFGYGTEMTVLAAVLFVVWASILGFGPSRWLGARAAASAAPPAGSRAVPPVPSVADPATAPGAPAAAFAPAGDAEEPAQAWRPPTAPIAIVPGPIAPTPIVPGPNAPAPIAPGADDAAAAERRTPPAPVAAARDDTSWPSEVDEVSAVHPSPFPPSAASARPYTPPPVSPAAGPITFVPGRKSAVPSIHGDAPVTRVPATDPAAPPSAWAPARSAEYDPDAFPEMSGEVSAVVGSPAAGTPLSARRSVSAQQRPPEPEGEDDDDDAEQTVIARRRRPTWKLTAAGRTVALVADVVILGRQPAPDPAFPRAQLVVVDDRTRTVSKTHARLELKGDGWHVTDLHSTNGVLIPTLMGTEEEIGPGSPVPAGDRFRLGDAQVTLARADH